MAAGQTAREKLVGVLDQGASEPILRAGPEPSGLPYVLIEI